LVAGWTGTRRRASVAWFQAGAIGLRSPGQTPKALNLFADTKSCGSTVGRGPRRRLHGRIDIAVMLVRGWLSIVTIGSELDSDMQNSRGSHVRTSIAA
jgi:hypothetical protein